MSDILRDLVTEPGRDPEKNSRLNYLASPELVDILTRFALGMDGKQAEEGITHPMDPNRDRTTYLSQQPPPTDILGSAMQRGDPLAWMEQIQEPEGMPESSLVETLARKAPQLLEQIAIIGGAAKGVTSGVRSSQPRMAWEPQFGAEKQRPASTGPRKPMSPEESQLGLRSQIKAEREQARSRATADDINFGYTQPDGTRVPPGGVVKIAGPNAPEKFAGEVTIVDPRTGQPATLNIWRDPDGGLYAQIPGRYTSGGFSDSIKTEGFAHAQELKQAAIAEFKKATSGNTPEPAPAKPKQVEPSQELIDALAAFKDLTPEQFDSAVNSVEVVEPSATNLPVNASAESGSGGSVEAINRRARMGRTRYVIVDRAGNVRPSTEDTPRLSPNEAWGEMDAEGNFRPLEGNMSVKAPKK